MRYAVIAIIFFASLAYGDNAKFLSNVEEIIKASTKKYDRIREVKATLKLIPYTLNQKGDWTESNDSVKILFSHKKPDKIKIEMFNTNQMVIISNGRYKWTYLPEQKRAMKEYAGESEKMFTLDFIFTNFLVNLTGRDKIEKKDMYVLEGKAKEKNFTYSKVICWLDAKELFPKKVKLFDNEGNPNSIIEFVETKQNVKLKDDLFEFGKWYKLEEWHIKIDDRTLK